MLLCPEMCGGVGILNRQSWVAYALLMKPLREAKVRVEVPGTWYLAPGTWYLIYNSTVLRKDTVCGQASFVADRFASVFMRSMNPWSAPG